MVRSRRGKALTKACKYGAACNYELPDPEGGSVRQTTVGDRAGCQRVR
jgi:hypothetical protein